MHLTGATHMIAGAAVAKAASRYLGPASLLLSLASHYLLDAIPHREVDKKRNILWGLITLLVVLLAAWLKRDAAILAGAFLGALPDLIWLLKLSKFMDRIHNFFHFKKKGLLSTSLSGMEAVLALVLILYLYLGR